MPESNEYDHLDNGGVLEAPKFLFDALTAEAELIEKGVGSGLTNLTKGMEIKD